MIVGVGVGCWGWTSYELEWQINTLILEVLMQGVVVVDRRGLTAVGATRRARGYMICMRERPRAREGNSI